MPQYFCSLPNSGELGHPKELYSDDDELIARFIKAEDRPGRGVYTCINPLEAGAKTRNLENVARLEKIYFDLDLQHIVEDRTELCGQLRALPFEFSWVHESGSSNFHLGISIKDPPPRGTPEYDRLVALWKRLADKLAADPAPAHPAALIRVLGSHNTKNGGNNCPVSWLWGSGAEFDITELEAIDELLEQPVLHRNPRLATNGHDTDAAAEFRAPIDADARLAAMKWRGPAGTSIHITQRDVVASMLARGIGLEETVRTVLEATRACVASDPEAANWDWLEEERNIWQSGLYFIAKNPARLVDMVPDYMRESFDTAVTNHKKPTACFRKDTGWHIRGYTTPTLIAGTDVLMTGTAPADKPAEAASSPRPSKNKPSERRVLTLRPFVPFDVAKLPPRTWLYAKHYQRRTVSLTAGPGGMGKSSLTMVEAVAMCTVRNLLGEQPEERLRIWLHNGEDPLDEIHRRLAAICQYYKIPQTELQDHLWVTSGNEFPLRVAKGYANLEIDTALVQQISDAISDNQIDLAIFDPFVTLHNVSEVDSGKMGMVIRLFGGVADENDAGVELAHHVRKPAAGIAADYDVHDIRGVAAITDAVRAARILNRMSEKDAEAAGCGELERLSRFRVDRAKGNYSRAQAATWRQFVSVELPNGDDVGVVAPWNYPGQGEQTPERAAADQKADEVFLHLLDKFLARNVNVSSNVGPTYAPARFAEDREAKAAKVSKAALKAAMNRLLDAGRIRSEPTGRTDRSSHRLVPWQVGSQ
jgi:RecA-family ATPase